MEYLEKTVKELIYENKSNFEIAKFIKNELKNYYKTLPEIFKKSSGKDFLVKHTKSIDIVIRLAYMIATKEMFKEFFPGKNAIAISIFALGSYGREQLSPKSDIDILIVYKDILGFNLKELIEKILYILWDCGLKLGHRVHEVSELELISQNDITIKTALLEARFIDGSKYLRVEVENALNHIRYKNQTEFILKKLEERKKLRIKYPLMMEPNLKEGVGGFRDANIVYWIGKILYNVPNIKDLPSNIVNIKDYTEFRIALEFLFRVRSALHLITNKKIDTLRLEYIPEVANILGYNTTPREIEKFTKKVHKSLRVIWLYSRIWLNNLIKDKVKVYSGYLDSKKEFKSSQDMLDFLISNANYNFRVHPQLNLKIIKTPKTPRLDLSLYPKILEIFKTKYTSSILQALLETNTLGYYITPIKKVEALPQFDGYHKYPVDTHLIQCIKVLENIKDSDIKKLYDNLSSQKKTILKLATFLHDCGKGREKDHHIVGERIFRVYAKKLKLSQEDINLGAKLIRYHNQLSKIAQKEDIYNSKVIAKFAGLFPSKEELDLIYILTYADVNSVDVGVYNEFTARLFKTLYLNAIDFLQHQEYLDEVSKRVKKSKILEQSKEFKELPKTLQKKILSIESNLPFIKYTKDRIIKISKKAIDVNNYIYRLTNDKFLTIEIIKAQEIDLGYILAKLKHLNIIHLDIIKLFDNKKYIKIDFDKVVEKEILVDIQEIIEESFSNKIKRIKLEKINIFKENIYIDCNHSSDYALMRIKLKDQKGALAYIINIFDKLGVDIVSTKIYKLKSNIEDMFLIEKNGNFCSNKERIVKELTL